MKPTLRPVTQFTLFLSLPAIPNILRAFPPPPTFESFCDTRISSNKYVLCLFKSSF